MHCKYTKPADFPLITSRWEQRAPSSAEHWNTVYITYLISFFFFSNVSYRSFTVLLVSKLLPFKVRKGAALESNPIYRSNSRQIMLLNWAELCLCYNVYKDLCVLKVHTGMVSYIQAFKMTNDVNLWKRGLKYLFVVTLEVPWDCTICTEFVYCLCVTYKMEAQSKWERQQIKNTLWKTAT